jgi:outer membrane lipoprotein SlyB
MRVTRRILGAGTIALLLAASAAAQAQQMAPAGGSPPPTPVARIRGTIEKADGQMLTVKARDGTSFMVKLADNGPVRDVVKASLSDIQVGTYLAITAMPQPDGSQKALAIVVFPAGPKPPDGFSEWDFKPGSTMTNATVDTAAAVVDGQKLTVKYKDGEKTIIVQADAEITTFKPGAMADLKAGKQIMIFAAKKLPDGTYEAPNISVGDYGVWR